MCEEDRIRQKSSMRDDAASVNIAVVAVVVAAGKRDEGVIDDLIDDNQIVEFENSHQKDSLRGD